MNILFVTHRLPYAPNRGDRIRTYHLLHGFGTFATVDLVSLVHDADELSHVPDLRASCRSVSVAKVAGVANLARGALRWGTARPLTHSLLWSRALPGLVADAVRTNRPDVIVTSGTGITPCVLEEPARSVPLVLDMVDVDSEKWRAMADTAAAPWRWIYRREHHTLAAFERTAVTHAASTLVVNTKERDTLAAFAPAATIHVVPNGVDLDRFAPPHPPTPSTTVIFTGVMNYGPNVEAVVWFTHDIWPAVVSACPAARFVIVGANPSSEVQRLASRTVTVTGTVPDTRPHLWDSAVAVAPLVVARGTQNKALEALAAGLPVVATSAVGDGLPSECAQAVDIADAPEAFAAAVIRWLSASPDERRRAAARANVKSVSWQAQLAALPEIVRRAAHTSTASSHSGQQRKS